MHYDRYDAKFKNSHDSLTWDEAENDIQKFKHEHIYPIIVKGEIEDNSMGIWLDTKLSQHSYEPSDEVPEKDDEKEIGGDDDDDDMDDDCDDKDAENSKSDVSKTNEVKSKSEEVESKSGEVDSKSGEVSSKSEEAKSKSDEIVTTDVENNVKVDIAKQ